MTLPLLRPGNRRDWVVSCDAFLEGVHFLAHTDPPDSVGYKSLVRATSDLAAMGALPRFFFLTLALPDRCTGKWFDRFLKGMGRASRETANSNRRRRHHSGIQNLHQHHGSLVKSAAGRAIKRSGARPGDLIFVTGRLGRAALGLELIQRGFGRQQIHPEIARAAFLSADSTRTRGLARAPSGRIIHDGRFGRPLDRSFPLVRCESSGRSRKRRTNPGRSSYRRLNRVCSKN